jgi:hypothetical protein
MRPNGEFVHVQQLIQSGLNDCAISRATGIPRPTVREWRVGRTRNGSYRTGMPHRCPICNHAEVDGWWYAYLLGMYLGDGCLAMHPRGVYKLRIVLDTRYPMIIDECAKAIRAIKGSQAPIGQVQCIGCVEVYALWKHWPCVFPQHGPGKKHLRRIELASWQQRIARAWPDRLIRGLIQSDGCRTINRVNGTDYPRYFFTNYSDDIRGIFTQACNELEVDWTASRWHTISVARRSSVAKLDAVVGPKTSPAPVSWQDTAEAVNALG